MKAVWDHISKGHIIPSSRTRGQVCHVIRCSFILTSLSHLLLHIQWNTLPEQSCTFQQQGCTLMKMHLHLYEHYIHILMTPLFVQLCIRGQWSFLHKVAGVTIEISPGSQKGHMQTWKDRKGFDEIGWGMQQRCKGYKSKLSWAMKNGRNYGR